MIGVYETAFSPLALLELLVVFAGFALSAAVAWRITKGGGGTAVTELSAANKVLETRLHEQRVEFQKKFDEQGAQIRDLTAKNAELAARTDYKAVIDEHEKRAQERAERLLTVLDLIAGRLGSDPPTT